MTWAVDSKRIGPLSGSKLPFTEHLFIITNKATGYLCIVFPLLTRDSTVSQKTNQLYSRKWTSYILTYAAPVWNSICESHMIHSTWNSKSSKRRRNLLTIPDMFSSHNCKTLNIEPIQDFDHQLTAKLSANCPSYPNPLVRQIGNYALDVLNYMYEKYKHKRLKHILLQSTHRTVL